MCALDALGKWSLLDFNMLAMMAVAFRLHLDVPAAAHAPADAHAGAHARAPAASSVQPLQASLEVTAQFGMFGFLAACSLSLATSHVLLALQRCAAAAAVAAARAQARAQSAASVRGIQPDEAAPPGRARLPPRRPLRSYRFRLPWAEGAPRVLSPRTQLAMVLLLGACALTILCGACVDTFSVRIGGLAGALLGGDARTRHSLVSTLKRVEMTAALGSSSVPPPSLPQPRPRAPRMILVSAPSPFEATRQPSSGPPKAADLRPNPLTGMGAALPYTSSRAPAAALGFFQAFFFAVCLVVPLLWLLLLALLWLVPLRPATQRRLLVAADVAQAWAA